MTPVSILPFGMTSKSSLDPQHFVQSIAKLLLLLFHFLIYTESISDSTFDTYFHISRPCIYRIYTAYRSVDAIHFSRHKYVCKSFSQLSIDWRLWNPTDNLLWWYFFIFIFLSNSSFINISSMLLAGLLHLDTQRNMPRGKHSHM